ncbi:MAG: gamma-glutamylcyclotransferase [Saprospiraceae bacterium]
MSSMLFVYGSLMGSIQSKIATFLHQNSDFLGLAYLHGYLYDLGSYPGLVLESNAPKVKGHIFKMHHPEVLLAYLDEYEGILLNNPDLNEYARQLVKVNLDGNEVLCWAYIYQLSTRNFPKIPYDNYLDYLKNQPGHQQFLDQV